MRILFATGIYPPDAGGPATYVHALASALTSQGHDVQVVCYGDRSGIDTHDGYPVERVSRRRTLPIRYWNFFQAVRRRAAQCDVIYLQGPVSEGLPGTLAAMFTKKPVVMKIVGDYAWEMYMQQPRIGARGASPSDRIELLDEFLTHRHMGKIRLLELIERWTVKRAKKIIVPSEYLKGVVMKWGIASEHIRVIYNGIEPLDQGRDRDEARRVFEIQDKRVLLTVVRVVPWKGGDFIISLLPDLPTDIILCIAGDGPSLDAWKQDAVRLGVSDRVRFLGRLDRVQLAEWYRAADLFVLATGYEGFSHVAVEAGAMGLSIYLSDRGGNPETQAMFASRVKILPYQDRQKWVEALASASWQRSAAVFDVEQLRTRMILDTLNILQSV